VTDTLHEYLSTFMVIPL